MSDQRVIGRFQTRKGNNCIVTEDKIIWEHTTNGTIHQLHIRDIDKVEVKREGGLIIYHFVLRIDALGVKNRDNTHFNTREEAEAMKTAIHTAMSR